MRKPTNKLTLSINTIRSQQATTLASVAGGRVQTDASWCTPTAHVTCVPKTGSCTQ